MGQRGITSETCRQKRQGGREGGGGKRGGWRERMEIEKGIKKEMKDRGVS